MKILLALLIAIFLNTSILLSEPLASLIGNIGHWPFLILETLLIAAWHFHKLIRDLRRECTIDFGELNVFVYRNEQEKK